MSVIKAIEFPEVVFITKEDLFCALKKHKDSLIDFKKASIMPSERFKSIPLVIEDESVEKGFHMEKGFIYPVINTTKYMDSHNDVHLDNIWNKSIKEQQGKIYYLADHSLEVGKVIAYPKDVELLIKEVTWRSVGANYEGKTQALIFKVDEKKIRLQSARDIISEKIDIEHSVRMQYVKIALAINSESEDFKEEKANFNKYVDLIANKERAVDNGYFWAIEEAKIYKEESMVLAGSNDKTPMLYPKNIQPEDTTDKHEPPNGTQRKSRFLLKTT